MTHQTTNSFSNLPTNKLNCWAHLLAQQPLLPVITASDSQLIKPLISCLAEAGFQQLEITLRHQNSWQALAEAAAIASQLKVNLIAGSLTSQADLVRLKDMNINWAVSPGWQPSLALAAQTLGINYLPAVATPGEAMQAAEAGFKQVKFFPAASLGSSYLTNLAAALPNLTFVPTGGINLTNLESWLSIHQVLAVGGSWLFASPSLKQKNYACFTQEAKQALLTAKKYKEAICKP